MRYEITIQFDPDTLLQKFADSQGIELQDVEEDIETILAGELNWLDASGIYVTKISNMSSESIEL